MPTVILPFDVAQGDVVSVSNGAVVKEPKELAHAKGDNGVSEGWFVSLCKITGRRAGINGTDGILNALLTFKPGNIVESWHANAGRMTNNPDSDPVTCPDCIHIQFTDDLLANARRVFPYAKDTVDSARLNDIEALIEAMDGTVQIHTWIEQAECVRNLGHALTILGPLKRGFRNTPGRKWLTPQREEIAFPGDNQGMMMLYEQRERNPTIKMDGGAKDAPKYTHPRFRKDPCDDMTGEDVAD